MVLYLQREKTRGQSEIQNLLLYFLEVQQQETGGQSEVRNSLHILIPATFPAFESDLIRQNFSYRIDFTC